MEKTKKIISESENVIDSQKDSEVFFDAIINAKAPNKELSEASKKFKVLFS